MSGATRPAQRQFEHELRPSGDFVRLALNEIEPENYGRRECDGVDQNLHELVRVHLALLRGRRDRKRRRALGASFSVLTVAAVAAGVPVAAHVAHLRLDLVLAGIAAHLDAVVAIVVPGTVAMAALVYICRGGVRRFSSFGLRRKSPRVHGRRPARSGVALSSHGGQPRE